MSCVCLSYLNIGIASCMTICMANIPKKLHHDVIELSLYLILIVLLSYLQMWSNPYRYGIASIVFNGHLMGHCLLAYGSTERDRMWVCAISPRLIVCWRGYGQLRKPVKLAYFLCNIVVNGKSSMRIQIAKDAWIGKG